MRDVHFVNEINDNKNPLDTDNNNLLAFDRCPIPSPFAGEGR
jgi:hypothetical protein